MTRIVPVSFPGVTARAASVSAHGGWLVSMMVLGLGSGLLALAFAVITSRWGRMYGLVSGLLRASRPDSGRFPQQAKQWVYQPHWGGAPASAVLVDGDDCPSQPPFAHRPAPTVARDLADLAASPCALRPRAEIFAFGLTEGSDPRTRKEKSE